MEGLRSQRGILEKEERILEENYGVIELELKNEDQRGSVRWSPQLLLLPAFLASLPCSAS